MQRTGLIRVWTVLILFGLGFAYVEAAVVVYLRALYDPIHARYHPDRAADDLFPLIRLDQLEAEGPQARRWLEIELAREFATLVMLAAVGLAVGQNRRSAFAAFLVAFGIWDLGFYLFLKLLIDWPGSLLTWDLLFLLPVPWASPVVAPMMVAASMIVSGATVLAREAQGRPFPLSRAEWLAVGAGGFLVVVAFCWDHRNLTAGGMPQPFHWPLFSLGESVGLAGFGKALWRHGGRVPEATR